MLETARRLNESNKSESERQMEDLETIGRELDVPYPTIESQPNFIVTSRNLEEDQINEELEKGNMSENNSVNLTQSIATMMTGNPVTPDRRHRITQSFSK